MNPKTKLGLVVALSFAALIAGILAVKQLRDRLATPSDSAVFASNDTSSEPTPPPDRSPPESMTSEAAAPPPPPLDIVPLPPVKGSATAPGETVSLPAPPTESAAHPSGRPLAVTRQDPNADDDFHAPTLPPTLPPPKLPVTSPSAKSESADLVPPPRLSLPKRSETRLESGIPAPDLPPPGGIRPASHTPMTAVPSQPPIVDLPPPTSEKKDQTKPKSSALPPDDLVPLPPVPSSPSKIPANRESKESAPIDSLPTPTRPMPENPPLAAPMLPTRSDGPRLELEPTPTRPMPENPPLAAPMLPTRSDGPRLELEPTPPTSNQKPAVLPTQESSKSVDPPAPELPRPIVEYPMPSKPMAPSKADLVVPGPDIPPEGKPATPLPLDLPPAKPMGSEPATSGNGTTPHRPGSESPAAPPLTIDPPTQRHPPAQSLPKPEKAADLRPLTSPNPQPNLVPPKDVGKPNSGKMPPPLETGPKPPSVPPVPVPSESGPKPPTEPPATLGSRPAPADPLETRVDSYDEDWYYCKSGDTLEAISQKFYYTPKYEQALRQYNLDRNYKPIFRQDKPILPSGEVVKVPPARILERTYPTLIPGYRSRTNEPVQTTPAAVRNPGQAPSSNLESIGSPRVYTVRREGMTLRDIAREELRDENQWTRIFNLNRQWNPSAPLPVGTSIYLPGSP